MNRELKVFFETTNYCNFKCIYCFANTCQKNSIILPFDNYKKIIDDLSTLDWDLSILLEGGEPLVVDNICEYGKYAKKYAKKVALGTNGSLIQNLNQKQLDDIKNTFEEVSLSLDATDPELFKKLTNHSIEPVLKGIDILNENQIKIKICAVITKYNVEFDNLVKFCEEKNIKSLRFYWFIPRETNDHSLLPSEKDYEYMLEKLKNYNGNVDIKINRTYTPFTNLVVSSKGEIKICADSERKNMQLIGSYNNFIDKLRMLLK
ncbi:MAG TPA: radical SAM protein [Rickettsiales bacterium]|nr:radical SAM protein [Rickettsiales bacterium]